jgi:hypothetical protein
MPIVPGRQMPFVPGDKLFNAPLLDADTAETTPIAPIRQMPFVPCNKLFDVPLLYAEQLLKKNGAHDQSCAESEMASSHTESELASSFARSEFTSYGP